MVQKGFIHALGHLAPWVHIYPPPPPLNMYYIVYIVAIIHSVLSNYWDISTTE